MVVIISFSSDPLHGIFLRPKDIGIAFPPGPQYMVSFVFPKKIDKWMVPFPTEVVPYSTQRSCVRPNNIGISWSYMRPWSRAIYGPIARHEGGYMIPIARGGGADGNKKKKARTDGKCNEK